MTQEELNAVVAAAYAEELDILTAVKRTGCACVIWMPEEIGDADPDTLEDIMIERGANYLDGGQVGW
jgi:hypothetical protein